MRAARDRDNKRRTKNGSAYFLPGTTRSRSRRMRTHASRVKPLPDTPATKEYLEQVGRLTKLLNHGLESKHGITYTKPRTGRPVQPHLSGVPWEQAAAVLSVKPEWLKDVISGRKLVGLRTLIRLTELCSTRPEQFIRVYDLYQQVLRDREEITRKRSELVKESLKQRMAHVAHKGAICWLHNWKLNPAINPALIRPSHSPPA